MVLPQVGQGVGLQAEPGALAIHTDTVLCRRSRGNAGQAPARSIFHLTRVSCNIYSGAVVGNPFQIKGRYELGDTLGRTDLSIVCKAYDTITQSDVAVKIIRATASAAALQSVYHGYELLRKLNHPDIVPILDLGEVEHEGHLKTFFVMPLLPQVTLDQLIKKRGQLTIQRSIEILTEVSKALGAAHDVGLVHRDLKPRNVFILPDDSVKVSDFLTAHLTAVNAAEANKAALQLMSPELLRNEPPTPLSDIFSLGVLAYQVFTRHHPFERPNEREVAEAILRESPPPISDLDPNVNQSISRVVNKAMAKQPAYRFPTANDFAECLQKAYRDEPIECFDPSRIRPRVERAKQAFDQAEYPAASEILMELEAEGHLDPEITQLRRQLNAVLRQTPELLEAEPAAFGGWDTSSTDPGTHSGAQRAGPQLDANGWPSSTEGGTPATPWASQTPVSRAGTTNPASPVPEFDATAVFLLPQKDAPPGSQSSAFANKNTSPGSSAPVSSPPLSSPPLNDGTIVFMRPQDAKPASVPPPTRPPEVKRQPESKPPPAPPPIAAVPAVAAAPPVDAPRQAVPPASRQGVPARILLTVLAVLLIISAAIAWRMLGVPKKAPVHVPANVVFQVHTSPPGASISQGDKLLGTSDSALQLLEGQYRLTAQKEGYEPHSFDIDLRSGPPTPYSVTLKPRPSEFHLFSALKQGTVSWDDKPSETLPEDGQLMVDTLEPGKHTLLVQSGAIKSTVAFEDQALTLPSLERPQATGTDAIAVASYHDQAVVTASSTADTPVLLDNRPAGRLSSGQIALKDLTPGPHTLTLGEWTGNFSVGPVPSLNLFLATLDSQGTLSIDVRGVQDAQVLVNNKLNGVAKNGKYKLSLAPGSYEILVYHSGFMPAKPQKITVRESTTSRVNFSLVPLPVPKPAPAPIVAPSKLTGTVTVRVTPGDAQVTYTRRGQSNPQVLSSSSLDLEPGSYSFSAHAPGYTDGSVTVEVNAGGTATVTLGLVAIKKAPAPVARAMRAEDWNQPWTKDEEWYTRQGGDFVLYKITPTAGVFRFAISPKSSKKFLGMGGNPKMRWVLAYQDSRNYIDFQIDKQSYVSEIIRNGKKTKRVDLKHNAQGPTYQLQVRVAPTKLSVEIRNADGKYLLLDEWTDPPMDLTAGQFGFRLPNQDQIFLTDFSFEQAPGAR